MDTFIGTIANDYISATSATFTGLDAVDGGAGTDTLAIVDSAASTALALPVGVTVKNVEVLSIVSNNDVGTSSANGSYDVSGFAGLNTANITSTGADYIKAATSTDVNIKSAAGAVTVAGGKSVTTNSAAAVTLTGGLISANVTTGTSSAAVKIGDNANSATGATAALVSVTVKGGSDVLVADYDGASSAASKGTLTTVTVSETGDSTVSLYGKALTTLNVGKQTTATAITVDQTGAATDQAFTLTVADSGKTGSSPAVVTVTNNTASSIALTANGSANNIKLDSDSSLKTVTVSGTGALTLDLDGSGNTALTTFDGSAATGALTLSNTSPVTSLKTGAGADTFTVAAAGKVSAAAGAGNDNVTIGAALTAGSSIDLGDGNDMLLSSSGSVAASSATLTTVVDGGAGSDVLAASLLNAGNTGVFKNFEILGLDNTSGTLDTSLLTSSTITGLALIAGGGTYTNLTAAQSLTAAVNTSGVTTLSFSGVSGTADAYSINFALDNSAATAAPTSANMGAGTVAAAGIENFTLASGGSKAWNSITLGADSSAKTVTITGAANLNLAFASGFGDTTAPQTGVSSIDGSAASGKLSVNTTNLVAAATGLTLKTGSADDTITLAQAATVDAGAGADDITVASAGGTLTGGAGNDIFRVANAVGTRPLVTIADLTAGDKIQFAASSVGTQTTLGAKIDVSAATTLAGAFAIAVGTSGYGTVDNASDAITQGKLAWFQYGGNTYLYDDNMVANTNTAADAAAVSATDVIVKILGLLDLSNATVASDAVTMV